MCAAILAFLHSHNLVRGGAREEPKGLGIMPISLLAFSSQLKSKVGNILAKATACASTFTSTTLL